MKKIIVLDAGHGGKDPGAAFEGVREKDITLKLALKAGYHLSKLDYEVFYTRERDVYVSLSKRVDFERSKKPTLFVSIHCNAAPNDLANGFEAFYCGGSDKGKNAASCILKQLHGDFPGLPVRSLSKCPLVLAKPANYYVLKLTHAPAVLVENLFITNPTDRGLLTNEQFLGELGWSLAIGIHRAIVNMM